MLKYLLLLISLGMVFQASAACTAISSWPANPTTGQTVSFSLSGCNSSCYSTCLAYHANWNISCQGSFVINGTTYNGSATVSGTGFSVVFNSNTNVTVTFSTQGNCASPCNGYLTKTFRVGPPPTPTGLTRPSTHLVPSRLVDAWKDAGADQDLLPSTKECINVHNEEGVVFPYEDGYRVDAEKLDDLIRSTDASITSVIYFQAAKYYFDKSEVINLRKDNLILSGEGADKTKFIIEDIFTSEEADAISFIRISSRTRVGVTCLSINTSGAFKSSYHHNNLKNGKFNAASIIAISNSNNCWVSGVQVHRGYGNTVLIARGHHNEVTNCFFYDHWTIGGFLGTGVQGYGVNISKSDNNLIENNSIGLSRHNIIIQGNSDDNVTADADISDENVVAYNYLYLAMAVHNQTGNLIYPSWNITFHGGGKNRDNLVEGNVCIEKIAVDDVKKSNGRDNTFYRNISKTQIEIEKGGSCHNKGQRYLGNTVYKNGLIDRYRIRGEDHVVVGNKKCNSSGGNCNTGTFNVGDKCGLLSGQNENRPLNVGETLGQSCYLTAVPSFLNFLPISNPDNVIPAQSFTVAPAEGCFTCTNVELPPGIIKEPTDPKEPDTGILVEKRGKDNQPVAIELGQPEELQAIAFPNPTAAKVTIQLKGAAIQEPVVFQLYNISGQLVGTTRVTLKEQNSFEYNVAALPKGIYIGTIRTKEQSYSVKIVKE